MFQEMERAWQNELSQDLGRLSGCVKVAWFSMFVLVAVLLVQ